MKKILPFFLVAYILNGCISNPRIVPQCLDVAPYIQSSIEGNILIHTGSSLVFLDVASGNVTPFDLDEEIPEYSITISPNGKWIAYVTYKSMPGYIIKPAGMKINSPEVETRFVTNEFVWGESERQENGEIKKYLVYMPSRSLDQIYYPLILPGQEAEYEGRWVAYRTEKEVQTLVVRSIDGNDFFEFPDPNNEWQVLFGWLDNTTLILIDYSGINAIDPTALNQPSNDKVVLFNPFTREKRISGDLYPDMVIPGG